ncbi:AsmA-like C-terminal region-containing protein [Pasteurella dagmatis]|nr:AsmA-like C-terminal region-containing protein [Pasteurella dagmatis]SNV42245.1 membrane protein [Pasteurella dagmatis]
MWKKLIVAFSVMIVLVCIVGYVQLQRVNDELTQRLKQQNIIFQTLDFDLYPNTQLTLSNANWDNPQKDAKVRSIFAEKLHLELDFWSLFQPQNAVRKLSFENAKLWSNEKKEPEFSKINGEITGDFFLDTQRFSFANAEVNIRFDKPILLNTKQIKLSIAKGEILRIAHLQYQFQWDYVRLNGEDFPFLKAQLNMNSPRVLELNGQIDYLNQRSSSTFTLNAQSDSISAKKIHIQGENIIAEQWLKVLDLPLLISGTTALVGDLMVYENQAKNGEFNISVQQGELKGLNLLTLVKKYLPINIDEQPLKEKNTDTSFDSMTANVKWDKNNAWLNQLVLKTKYITVTGNGSADLATMQCDITLNLGLSQLEYDYFQLPIRFFDNCHSPQYKVEFNKNFRHQLKTILKEKFR